MKSALLIILSFLIMAVANIVNAQPVVKLEIAVEEIQPSVQLHEIGEVDVEFILVPQMMPAEEAPVPPSPDKELEMKEKKDARDNSRKNLKKRQNAKERSCGKASGKEGAKMKLTDKHDDKNHCAKGRNKRQK